METRETRSQRAGRADIGDAMSHAKIRRSVAVKVLLPRRTRSSSAPGRRRRGGRPPSGSGVKTCRGCCRHVFRPSTACARPESITDAPRRGPCPLVRLPCRGRGGPLRLRRRPAPRSGNNRSDAVRPPSQSVMCRFVARSSYTLSVAAGSGDDRSTGGRCGSCR